MAASDAKPVPHCAGAALFATDDQQDSILWPEGALYLRLFQWHHEGVVREAVPPADPIARFKEAVRTGDPGNPYGPGPGGVLQPAAGIRMETSVIEEQ